jgi:Sulfotransferase family
VLVTGAPRSGTTWVGQVLAAARGMGYVREPFHPGGRPGICVAEWRHWFELVPPEETRYDDALRAAMDFDYGWRHAAATVRGPRRAVRVVIDGSRCASHRLRRHRPLFKDPIGFFSAPWLADRFGFRVAVLVRHPGAFTASLRRVNWRHDLRHFRDQPRLMALLDPADQAEIHRHLAEGVDDDVEHAALLWRVFYGVARTYRAERGDWAFVRHEDLAGDPGAGFRELCDALAVPFDRGVQRELARTTGGEAAATVGGPVHQLRRDSAATAWSWRSVLSSADTDRLEELTRPVWPDWYDEASWGR